MQKSSQCAIHRPPRCVAYTDPPLTKERDPKERSQQNKQDRDRDWEGDTVVHLREQLGTRIDELAAPWKAEKERKQKEEANTAKRGEGAPGEEPSKVEDVAVISDDEPILVGETSGPKSTAAPKSTSTTKKKARPGPKGRRKGKTPREIEEDEVVVEEVRGKAERFR